MAAEEKANKRGMKSRYRRNDNGIGGVFEVPNSGTSFGAGEGIARENCISFVP